VLLLVEQFSDALLLVMPNPVDVLTHIAWMLSSFPTTGIIDSVTNLDSSRFRFLLAEHLDTIWQLPYRGTGYPSPSPRARYRTSQR
jgi:L-lactate dehydrogenase